MRRRALVVGIVLCVVAVAGVAVTPVVSGVTGSGISSLPPADVATEPSTATTLDTGSVGGGTDATDAGTMVAAADMDDPGVAAPRTDRRVTGPEATLYLGERDVDVTGLDGASAAGQPQRFYGVGGAAEGLTATVDDASAVDVTGANSFVPGEYALSSGGDTAVVVRQPTVTDVSLYTGTSVSGADVTNQSVPRGTEQVTVEAEFNFGAAENATLVVEDGEGLDVTEQLTASPAFSASGDTVTLDVRELSVGQYDVRVEGADDLDGAAATVTLRVRDPEKTVTLSKTRVVRGEPTVASLAGAPGDVRYLRIAGKHLRAGAIVNTATAREVFDRTAQVQSVGADPESGYVYAQVAVDEDGISEVRVQTERLATESVDVEMAPTVGGASEDDVTLDVGEREVVVASIPETTVGETVTVSGTAPESERVKLYAAVDGVYVPLYADADGNTLAEPEVRSDGSWTIDIDTGTVVDLPGSYRVVAVADPGESRLDGTGSVDAETLRSLEPRGSSTLTTVEGGLSLAASRSTVAATGSDAFTLSGAAPGQERDLRLYRVGPRGAVDAREVDVSGDTFAETVDGLDTRGVHAFVVVGHGRDGTYAYADRDGPSVDALFSGSESQEAALATLVDAYTGAGVDDTLRRVNVTAATATLSISTPSGDDPVGPTTVAVAGQSTAEDGSTVFVEVLADDGAAVRSAETPVRNGQWNTTLDLTGLSPGSYRLAAESATESDAVTLNVTSGGVQPQSSPTATATATPEPGGSTATPAGTPVDRTTADVTGDGSETTTVRGQSSGTTSTRFPGFGPVTGVVAVVAALLLVARGRRP